MGEIVSKFEEIDRKLNEEISRISDEREREKKEREKEEIALKMKFQEIVEFISRNDITVSNLAPEDFAVENGAAYVVAKNVKDKMKVNQLRKFFTQIKRIDNELKGKNEDDSFDSTKTILLLPELAYAYGRGLITKEFYELMKLCLSKNKLSKIKDFKNLVNFLSAILAYYKMLS